MFDALNIAASGLDTAGAMLNAAAQSLVSLNNPGTPPGAAEVIALPAIGDSDLTPVEIISQPGSIDAPIQLKKAQVLYAANAQVISSEQQMFGSLIDLLDTSQTQQPDEDSDSVL